MFYGDKFGRIKSIAASAVCLCIGLTGMAFAPAISIFILGRAVAGLGLGIGFSVVPIYLQEIVPCLYKGKLVVSMEISLCLGILLTYVMVAVIPPERVMFQISNSNVLGWRALVLLGVVIAIIQLCGLYLLPESPAWLRMKGQSDKAEIIELVVDPSMRNPKLSTSSESKTKNIDLAYQLGKDRELDLSSVSANEPSSPLMDITMENVHDDAFFDEFNETASTKKYYLTKYTTFRMLEIAIGVGIAHNFTTANSLIYYSQSIFGSAGVVDKYWPGVLVGLVKVAGVCVLLLLMDTWGRKTMLMIGTAGIAIGHFCLSIGFHYAKNQPSSSSSISTNLQYFLVTSLLLAIFMWNVSWAGAMFVVAAEVLPDHLRSFGMGGCICAYWVMGGLLQAVIESVIKTSLGESMAFLLFGCSSLCSFVWVAFRVVETGGKSREEIIASLEHQIKPVHISPTDTIRKSEATPALVL